MKSARIGKISHYLANTCKLICKKKKFFKSSKLLSNKNTIKNILDFNVTMIEGTKKPRKAIKLNLPIEYNFTDKITVYICTQHRLI